MRTKIIPLLCSMCCALTAVAANHDLPRHRAYAWSGMTLDDLQGDICIPVLFVNFADPSNDNENTVSQGNQTLWMNRLNDASTSNHLGEEGSVNDYFKAQSYGLVNVTFENIGTYTASGKASDYTDYGNCSVMLRKAAQTLTDIDWSRYDSNGDMEVDCLLVIYAGHCDDDESSRRAHIKSIYPHRNWMSSVGRKREALSGGYYLESYVFANDLRHRSTSVAATNTVCHELGHGIFDLTDYYKNLTSYLGQYDAMCYGYRQMTYGAATDHCCDFTSFNRMYLGWMTPRELTEPCHVRLRPLSQADEAYVIFDPKDDNHFFLLENRATLPDTWDAHLPTGGLVVVEVNWQRDAFEYHSVNGTSRKNIRVICAATGRGLAISNDVYYNFDQTQIPYGIEGRTGITADVHRTFETQPVTGITVNDDASIEFDFMGGGAGLDQIMTDENPVSYDLYGRPASTSTHGLLISNGRKIYVNK